VYVTVAPTGRFTVSVMFPVPLPLQVAPPAGAHVHAAPRSDAGGVSVTVAPVTAVGPLFVATIVYVMASPAEAVLRPSVFVIDKSAARMIVSVSVALLFARLGSVIPARGITVAVFDSVPEALMSSVPVAVKVAVPPTSRFAVWLMFPEPLAAAQLDPADAVHVHVTPVRLAGKLSVTVAPVTTDGPALLTVIVYVTGEPAPVVVRPSIFVIDRSAVIVSVSVALLFAMLGSVIPAGGITVAVFDRVPEALMSSVPVAVNVAVPPTSRLTVWLMFPEPLAAAQLDPADAVHVHATPERLAGKLSTTEAPATPDGPALLAVIVYVTGDPAPVVVLPSVLVIERSACMLTTMQPVPTTLWPSGLVRVTFLVPFELALTFSVTDVGLLNVTLLTITPGVTAAVRRLG
jgi:hypothetical protein